MGETWHNPAIWTPDEYLSGPGGTMPVHVHPGYGTEFRLVLANLERFWRAGLEQDGPETESLIAPGYRFRGVPAGVLVVAPDGSPAGGYLQLDLSIAAEHQGRGLGPELIVEYVMRYGCLPLWEQGAGLYSEAGIKAHKAAGRLATHPAFVAAKRDMLSAAVSRGGPAM